MFGRGDCGDAERDALLAALSGKRVAPGPAGSPYRGRRDVLPTGRNLFAVDPRAVPTRAAHAQGIKLAEELLRRHLQDHGDWPKGLVVDLWGSATMRTAGEEFAMALQLAGVAPRWDAASGRLTGFEIIPLAALGRPRIDVTLRVSGLFRDVFTPLAQLFEAASEALSQRDFEGDENPYLARAARVFGPRPGTIWCRYGADARCLHDGLRGKAAGEAWLSSSSWSIASDGEMKPDREGIEARLAGADTFVHVQDLPETDLLLASDYAAHEAGVAAAAASLGSPIAVALSSRRDAAGDAACAVADGGDFARGALARRQSELDRRHDAPRLSRRRRDRGDAGAHGGLRASRRCRAVASVRSLL